MTNNALFADEFIQKMTDSFKTKADQAKAYRTGRIWGSAGSGLAGAIRWAFVLRGVGLKEFKGFRVTPLRLGDALLVLAIVTTSKNK